MSENGSQHQLAPDMTPDQRRRFLESLRNMPNIRHALKQVGLSREQLIELRERDRPFDVAVECALEDGRDNLRMMITMNAVGVQQDDGTFKGRSERLLGLVAKMHLPEFGAGGGRGGGGGGEEGGSRAARNDDQRNLLASAPIEPTTPAERGGGTGDLDDDDRSGGVSLDDDDAVDEVVREVEEAVVAEKSPGAAPAVEDGGHLFLFDVGRPSGPAAAGLGAGRAENEGSATPAPEPAPRLPQPAPTPGRVQPWQRGAVEVIRRRFLALAGKLGGGGADAPSVVEHMLAIARGRGEAGELEAIVRKLGAWASSASAENRKAIASIEADARTVLRTIRDGGI